MYVCVDDQVQVSKLLFMKINDHYIWIWVEPVTFHFINKLFARIADVVIAAPGN